MPSIFSAGVPSSCRASPSFAPAPRRTAAPSTTPPSWAAARDENGLALDADASGRLVVAGTTRSSDFPVTPGAPQSFFRGGLFYGDVFVACLSPAGDALDFATYHGGSGDDLPMDVAALPGDVVLVGGWTGSANLPVNDALDATLGGTYDAFLATFDAAASVRLHATYLGGESTDKVGGLAVHPTGAVIVSGFTMSEGFPVTEGAWDTTFDGVSGLIGDSFVASVDLGLAAPASGHWVDLGFGMTGSAGMPALGSAGSLEPGLGTGEVVLQGARPDAAAVVLVGLESGYLPLRGGTLVPWPILLSVPFTTSEDGGVTMPYTIGPGTPSGLAMVLQIWNRGRHRGGRLRREQRPAGHRALTGRSRAAGPRGSSTDR